MKYWLGIPLGIFIGVALAAIYMLVVAPPRGEPIELPPAPTPGSIVVSIIGAVNSPGVYQLNRDARIMDAINWANGMTQDADPQSVNLAAKINDGDQIVILSRAQQATQQAWVLTESALDPRRSGRSNTPTPVFPININLATQQELEELPSIGPTRAAQIIAYRQEHGPFEKIEDLQKVSGITSSIYAQIKNLITVGQ